MCSFRWCGRQLCLRNMPISGVNSTPRPTAVYASDPASPRRLQDSLPSRLLGFERTRLALASSFQLSSRTPHCALLFASPRGLCGLSLPERLSGWSNHSDFRVWYSRPLYSTAPSRSPVGPGLAELPGRLSLRLDVYSPPQVLQIDGRLCHLVLAFLVAGDFINSRAPSLRGRYPASTLLRTHPSPSRLRSTSRLSRLYDRPCSGDFAPGRGGLLQLLGMSLPPCCRFHPAEVKEPHRSDFGSPCCLRPPVVGSAFGATHFRGHIRVHCRYGPVTRRLPKGDVVDRLQSLGFPPPCYPNYGAPDSYPGRPLPC